MRTAPRNIVVAAVGITVSAVALTGCSTNASTPTDGTTLTVATDFPERIEGIVSAFEAANPGVTVQVESGGQSYEDFIRTQISAGSAPDVIRVFPGEAGVLSVGALDQAGVLADLSDEAWTSELTESQSTLFGYEGKVLSVPIGSVAIGAVYNDQTLAEIGATIPETLPEVLDYCAAAKAAGKVGYALFQKGGSVLTSYALAAPLVYGPDPSFTQEQIDGSATFADSGWVQVLDVQLQMLQAGCFNESPNGTDFTAAAQLVADGSAVGIVAFTDITGITSVAPEDATFTMGPVPATDSADDNYLAVANSTGFAVNADAAQPELARAFVAFVATSEAQNSFAEATGGAPAIPNDEFSADNQLQQFLAEYVNAGKTGIWPDQEWPGGEVAQALLDASQALFAGTMTVDEAVANMDAGFQTALAAK